MCVYSQFNFAVKAVLGLVHACTCDDDHQIAHDHQLFWCIESVKGHAVMSACKTFKERIKKYISAAAGFTYVGARGNALQEILASYFLPKRS